MDDNEITYQVAIVGGGPVGLFLACSLHKVGISCIVLEKRDKPTTHSRSIGIHPVSLELFDDIDIADSFINAGTKVERGLAFSNSEHIGTLSFAVATRPYSFLLTLPQYKTEALLNEHLHSRNPDILWRNHTVTDIQFYKDHIQLATSNGTNTQTVSAQYVVGCDGKQSFIRQAADISFNGRDYDDTYIMGDFTDNTRLGNDAAVYICNEGLIESFPLSSEERRWVVKTDHFLDDIDRRAIEHRVSRRIGHELKNTGNSMLSSFHVEKRFAATMAKGRVLLAGDSAHIVSPIGGQGMNLGWLDAARLTACFAQIFGSRKSLAKKLLHSYSKERLQKARRAARRAEFNMAIGRKSDNLFLRKWFIKGLLHTPIRHLMVRLFTMRGL